VWIAKKAYQRNKETSPEGSNEQINIMTRVMIREQLNKERSAKTYPESIDIHWRFQVLWGFSSCWYWSFL